MKPCNCTPPVKDPRFKAFIATHGIGVWSAGSTIEDAIENVKKHAKKDGIGKRKWVWCWVEKMGHNEEVVVDGFTKGV